MILKIKDRYANNKQDLQTRFYKFDSINTFEIKMLEEINKLESDDIFKNVYDEDIKREDFNGVVKAKVALLRNKSRIEYANHENRFEIDDSVLSKGEEGIGIPILLYIELTQNSKEVYFLLNKRVYDITLINNCWKEFRL